MQPNDADSESSANTIRLRGYKLNASSSVLENHAGGTAIWFDGLYSAHLNNVHLHLSNASTGILDFATGLLNLTRVYSSTFESGLAPVFYKYSKPIYKAPFDQVLYSSNSISYNWNSVCLSGHWKTGFVFWPMGMPPEVDRILERQGQIYWLPNNTGTPYIGDTGNFVFHYPAPSMEPMSGSGDNSSLISPSPEGNGGTTDNGCPFVAVNIPVSTAPATTAITSTASVPSTTFAVSTPPPTTPFLEKPTGSGGLTNIEKIAIGVTAAGSTLAVASSIAIISAVIYHHKRSHFLKSRLTLR